MKIGIAIIINEAEPAWNYLKFGVVSLKANHKAKIFLMNKGFKVEEIRNLKYNTKKQILIFLKICF